MEKVKFICIKSSDTKELITKTGLSRGTVYNALYFRSHSERAETIRQMAVIDYGGKTCYKYK